MTVLRIAMPLALVALVSWADHGSDSLIFGLFAPLVAAFVFVAFFPLWPEPAYWRRAALVSVATLWLAALPWIPWNHIKRFYRDCGRIERGWSLARAKEAMAPYVLASAAPGKAGPQDDLDQPHLVFWPDRGRIADWCIVFHRGEEVRKVSAYPD